MNVAFIPVRGGSKSIPLKNIKEINGKPLVYWTILAACGCKSIDKVYVATDSKKICSTIEQIIENEKNVDFAKLEVIGRSKESASDTASTEFAMIEFAKKYAFDNIVLIQATSPLLTSKDLNNGFEVFSEEKTDSVLSVVRQKRFHWAVDEKGYAYSTNYDVYNRPRRQEFEGYYVENGAFYITSKKNLLNSGNRLSGNIRIVEMGEETFYEIDEKSDWTIVESLMKTAQPNEEKPLIKMFLTDCDGCLTDGGMYYSEKGDELKKFNTRDGVGFEMLRNAGILTGIVTGENVELNRRRADKINVDIYEAGCKNKKKTVIELCKKYEILPENVAYVGDDINDEEVIKMVGLGCCPNDAISRIKNIAHYVSSKNGGDGVVREVAEMILGEI